VLTQVRESRLKSRFALAHRRRIIRAMSWRLAVAVALVALLAAATPVPAVACTCGGTTPTSALAHADVAFTGVVVDVVDSNPMYPVTYSGGDEMQYTVLVEERLKGSPPDLTVVRSLRDGAACGLVMAVGERWLLYGHSQDIYGANQPGETWVFLCDANQLISANASFASEVVHVSGPMYPVPGVHIGLMVLLAGGIIVGSLTVFIVADRHISRGPRRRRAGTGSAPPPG
jgi:hypothetical protein